MEEMVVKAEPRSEAGTRVSRKLRASGRLPVIIYGHGETPEAVSVSYHDVEVALRHGARTLLVEMGGKTTQYLIKVVQYDHLDHLPIHLDLARVDKDERVQVKVAIELRGEPKGASTGGVLEQLISDLEVDCLMTEIPETLHPFVTELEIGDALFVRDLELPAGVVALADADDRVAILRAPTVVAEDEEDAEAGEEEGTAEPERIGRVSKKDEEASGKGDG